MQRAYSVLIFGLMLTLHGFVHGETSYEFDGTVYKFRQKNDGQSQQSPVRKEPAETSRPGAQLQSEADMLRQLEEQGYVFRPMRKRKTLDDPPVKEKAERANQGDDYQACPTPEAAQRMPQANPVNPVQPAPGMPQPPLGYPYTYPSPYSFPYPSGGFAPFPGGFGYPSW